MRATIIADASYCPNTRAGGYGYYISSDRGRRAGGGSFKNQIDGSSAAEIMAIVNAFYEAHHAGLIQSGDHVLLQTDCQSAIDLFMGQRRQGTKDEIRAKREFFAKKESYRVTISFRHVKGHSGRSEARFVTNNLCDARARKGMRLARLQFAANEENANEE